MKVINLSLKKSLLNNFVAEIRDKQVQTDTLRFRRNLERIGEVMAFEVSKVIKYKSINVETPLGVSEVRVINENIVVASILRAGLPLHNGFLSMFDKAENAFVSAYRKYIDEKNFNIHVEYISAPSIEGKTLILCDPMLATGSSMELAYNALIAHGTPAKLHIASIVASTQAIDYLNEKLPYAASLWVAAIDDELNSHAYIVPGIGDAGDLAFGAKLDVVR